MTEQEYQNTLRVLDQTKITHWDPVMSGGKPLVERLSQQMLATPCLLSVRQQVNTLMVLFRLRGWGDQQSLISVLKAASESTVPEVREQAAKLSAGLLRLSREESHKNEEIDAVPLIDLLRILLGHGLSKDTANLIHSLLPDSPDSPPSTPRG
jgi:hypothetical protein